MLQFHGCTGIGAEEALSEMAGLSSFGAAGYQALMPLGATSEKLEIAPAKLARTVGGKPKGTHCNCVPSAVEALPSIRKSVIC
jgi:hypothetical protein